MREGFARLIQDQKGMEVVGMATNGQQAIAMTESLRPDVVVMDVNMPVMDGIQATRRITADHPMIRVIGLTFYEDELHRQAMFEAGAENCLNKSDRSGLLIKAIANPPNH
jgi:DNA-binding NarL/FixJ family response regulator